MHIYTDLLGNIIKLSDSIELNKDSEICKNVDNMYACYALIMASINFKCFFWMTIALVNRPLKRPLNFLGTIADNPLRR